MLPKLNGIFDAITPPLGDQPGKPIYAAMPIPSYDSYLIGKDQISNACLLVLTTDYTEVYSPPIRLESLDVQFQSHCELFRNEELYRQDTFTVIRCLSHDRDTILYFLSICETILHVIGDKPTQPEIAKAVHCLTTIFHDIQKSPTRSVNGLFGELYLLRRSSNPAKLLTAWRLDDSARFDFSYEIARLDVKTSVGRARTHVLTYDQCNPPLNTIAIAASLFVERIPSGTTLRTLIDEIEKLVEARSDLVFKLHEVVATTLGANLASALAIGFDTQLAESSLRFFNLLDVPGIRGTLPAYVSDVHFRSDFSGIDANSIQSLINCDPVFSDLLPDV